MTRIKNKKSIFSGIVAFIFFILGLLYWLFLGAVPRCYIGCKELIVNPIFWSYVSPFLISVVISLRNLIVRRKMHKISVILSTVSIIGSLLLVLWIVSEWL